MIHHENKLLTETDAAQMLGLSVRSLQGWRLNGRGPKYLKLSKAVRYSQADLTAWLESRAVGSTAQADRLDSEVAA